MNESNEMLMKALAQLLESESSAESQQYKNLILKRIAEETEVKPTRIPAPLNITEIGGYYNLLEQMKVNSIELEEKKLKMQMDMIASALGLPV